MAPKYHISIFVKATISHRPICVRMKLVFQYFLAFHFSFFIFQSCGLDVEDPVPPSPPRWVQKSLPEEWPERGIDAHESGGIYLEWEPNLEEEIVAYNIYRATWNEILNDYSNFKLLTRISLESAKSLEYIDTDTQAYILYSYIINSENDAQNMSEYSDSINYSLLPQISDWPMTPNNVLQALNTSRTLTWTFFYGIEMQDYCLTILDDRNNLISSVVFMPGNYEGGYEHWQIPLNIELDYGTVYYWRIDSGANYLDGRETTGSESAWASFIYMGE